MKIKPQIYAKILIESAKADNLKVIAKNFWHMLQKNKQYKDLGRILEELEIESARSEGKTIAKVYSEKPLDENEILDITQKLSAKNPNTKYVIRNTAKSGTTGIIVKVEDKIIDLSAEGKIIKLREKLNKNTGV
ncbi:MAG: F0F1 ATP synthase subunit delta [Patescibacteria group bacterium]|jgi:F0F1-type ATP synthase delta subunit